MGFRGGVASATVVDTRYDPAGAGVQIQQDNTDPLRPRGIVRFTDGLGGDVDALIYQHAEGNPRSQNSGNTGGLTLDGGSYGGTPAPKLNLAVIPDGSGSPGSNMPQATLTGGPLNVDRPIVAGDAAGAWQALSLAGAWTNWDLSANACVIRRDAAGTVHGRGIAKVAAGSSIAVNASSVVANLPAGFFVPNVNDWRVIAVLNGSGVLVGYSQAWLAGGALVVSNNTSGPATAGYGFVLGFSFPTT